MKQVSFRKDFFDVDGAPMAPAAWFGLPKPEGLAFNFVHGYNCEAQKTMDAYRSNAEVLRETGIGLPAVGILWPGLGGSMLEAIEFHRAQSQAHLSGIALAAYLSAGPPGVVMAHSLGAAVALEAIAIHGAKAEMLVLIGAAVRSDCFSTNGQYAGAGVNVKHVLSFASKRDEVLGRAFFLDQLGTPALGHDGPAGSIPPWLNAFDQTDTVSSHGNYRFDRAIWKLIKAALG
jgi:pimeloyl-ACP methyl ester carboxylesterase